ncbi:MAG: hypothetical protein AAF514_07120 [Verrucomicrobiota bacterium]
MSETPPKHGERDERGHAIKLAVITSFLSKFGNIILQIVAVPIAIRVLGDAVFGVYATVAGVLAILTLTELGLFTSTATAISDAVARGDRRREKMVFTTGMVIVALVGIIVAVGLILLFQTVPVTTLFGAEYAPFAEEVKGAILVGTVIFIVMMLTTVTLGARLGYQEVHKTNLFGAAGNLGGGLLLIAGINHFPSVNFLLIAVIGSKAMADLLNCVHLLWKRPYLLPRLKWYDRKTANVLVAEGVNFSIAQNGVYLAQREGCKFFLAHLAGPSVVAIYAILLQLSVFLTGLVWMILKPLIAALTDAAAKQDLRWILGAQKKVTSYILAYCGLVFAGLLAFGQVAIGWWIGDEIIITRDTLVPYGLYFGLLTWSSLNYTLLIGVGCVRWPARVYILEIFVLLGFAYLGAAWFGVNGMLWGMVLAIGLVSMWSFPVKLNGLLGGFSSQWKNPLEAGAEVKAGSVG